MADNWWYEYETLDEAIKRVMDKEKERYNMDLQRRVQGSIEIPGVDLVPRNNDGTPGRAGHDDRKRVIHHIKEMEAKGYIPEEEATARIEQAASAQKSGDLRLLTSDLPAPVDSRGFWQRWDWDAEVYYIPVLLAGMFASVCSAVLPGIILDRMHEFNTVMGLAMFIPLLVLGVFGFFTSLSVLVVKMS